MIYFMMPKVNSIKNLLLDCFLGLPLIGNISKTVNATILKLLFFFFGPTFKE